MTLTPEQFNKLATKDEFNELKTEVREIKNDVKIILTGVDGLAEKLDDIEHAFVSNQAAHDRFESRLSRIEKHLNLNPLFER